MQVMDTNVSAEIIDFSNLIESYNSEIWTLAEKSYPLLS